MKKILQTMLLLLFVNAVAMAHNLDSKSMQMRVWTLDNQQITASFLMLKNNEVYLENTDGQSIHVALNKLSLPDQKYVAKRYEQIVKINQQIDRINLQAVNKDNHSYSGFVNALGILSMVFFVLWLILSKQRRRYLGYFMLVGVASLIYSFNGKMYKKAGTTSPQGIDSAFAPFKPNVVTHWDNTWFYVESKGIPTTHEMMTGITGWQQQVPIPQCYIGSNAWSIPLKPVVADTPVPVNASHFLRGAIAIAANGIAIFNPYTNTGVDAFLDGQLDNWGGHCGRADDYHYHTAPLHLYGTTAKTLPIAYALDGFAVYGSFEPDGSAMKTLDANHGHYASNGIYHYHGSAAAPYMIGNMVGKVTEDATMQIIPQAAAKPVRPSLTPLKGAVITGCIANGTNGYTLSYTLSSQNYQVKYRWTAAGEYTFDFINPSGTTTSKYNGFTPCDLPVTAVIDPALSKMKVFPNPAKKQLNILWPNTLQTSQIEGIQLISLTGDIVYSSREITESINCEMLKSGLYILRIQTNTGLYSQKIILQ